MPRTLPPAIGAIVVVTLAAAGCAGLTPRGRMAPLTASGDVFRGRLANGLDVVLVPNPVVPLVTVQIAVKNGAFVETKKTNGLSHFYEHMFFKGNEKIPTQEAYMTRVRELGIDFNGYTSDEAVRYFFTLPKYNELKGLTFMYDAITSPLFDPAEVKKEIGAVMGEFDRNEAQPGFRFREEMGRAVWWKYPERKDPLGDRDVVRGVTLEQLKEIQRTYYIPGNSALIVTGDLDPEDTYRRIAEVFSSWRAGPDPFAAAPVPAHPPLTESKTIVVHEDVRAPGINIMWHGPSVTGDPKGTYAADVLARALSGGSSQFQKRLVDSGLTVGAGFSYYTQVHTGPVYASARARPEKVAAAIEAITADLPRFADPDYVTDADIERAKIGLVRDMEFEKEKVQDFGLTLGYWWCTGGIDYYLGYEAGVKAVTRADIRAFLERYVWGKPTVTGVMISKADDEKHLAGFAAQRFEKPAGAAGPPPAAPRRP